MGGTKHIQHTGLGGSDGGLYTCAQDLETLLALQYLAVVCYIRKYCWPAFLKPHIATGGGRNYGLGVYRFDHGGRTANYAVGGDFGVDFFTAYFPEKKLTASALGNTEVNTYPLLNAMLSELSPHPNVSESSQKEKTQFRSLETPFYGLRALR